MVLRAVYRQSAQRKGTEWTRRIDKDKELEAQDQYSKF